MLRIKYCSYFNIVQNKISVWIVVKWRTYAETQLTFTGENYYSYEKQVVIVIDDVCWRVVYLDS